MTAGWAPGRTPGKTPFRTPSRMPGRDRFTASWRQGRWSLLVAAAALVATACTGLPTTSPVMVGRGVDEQVAPAVRIVVPPPAPGETPEQIVRGFLRAGAAFQDAGEAAPAVATAYLSRGSVDRWRPTTDVTIFDRSSLVGVEFLAGDRVQISVTAVAKIDDGGRYRELAPGTIETATLGLSKSAGEWRIDLPDNGFGLWINTDDFSQVFGAYPVHYPAVGGKILVPDVRWFPVGPRLVTALARAQLSPVPDYLKGAVESGFPEGVKLALDAVDVTNGVASVVLSSTASGADASQRRAIWAQLTKTLLAASGISAVTVQVQGSGRLAVPEVAGAARSVAELGYAVTATDSPVKGLVRVGTALRPVDVGRLAQLEQPPEAPSTYPDIPLNVTGLAWSADSLSIAGVGPEPGTLSRWRGRTQVSVPPFAAALVRPSFDARGRLWLAGSAPDGSAGIWTLDATSSSPLVPESLTVPWLAARSITALAVSPDATRVVVVSRAAADGDRVDIAGIIRDASGRPASLSAPLREAEALRSAVHATWIDEVTVAVAGATSTDVSMRPYLVELGQGIGLRRRGTVDPEDNLPPSASGVRWLVSTGGPRGVVIVTAAGGVLVRVGGAWRTLTGASDVVVPPVR